MKRLSPFWLLTIAVFILLTLPVLVQDGMFMDAMLYTSVAHNQSMGTGTFWFPEFSRLNLDLSGISAFHEQPPLVFGILSFFFRLLGDSMYVERLYVLLTLCITGGFIILLWRNIYRGNESLIKLSWLPVCLWITIPVVYWSGQNNVHENTMGIFTIASVLLTYRALRSDKPGWWWSVASGMMIFLATMSKGFPGFFPLGVPFLYWLSFRNISLSKTFLFSALLLLTPLLLYGVLWQFPASRESLSVYLFKRAFFRIAENPTTANRFKSLIDLLQNLLPQIAVLLVILSTAIIRKVKIKLPGNKQDFWFFLLVGLSASAPLMLTLVQKAFYMLPCFPYFAIALGIWIAPFLPSGIVQLNPGNRGFKRLRTFALLVLCGAILFTIMQKGKISRDRETLHDVYLLREIIPAGATIGVTGRIFSEDWALQCYLMRYQNISLDYRRQKKYDFYLKEKNRVAGRDMASWKKLDLDMEKYELFKRVAY